MTRINARPNLLAACWVAFAMLSAPSVRAQQSASPPPNPNTDDDKNGPSLADTMKFIQDKLNDIGSVNFIAYGHDNVRGNDWAKHITDVVSQVVADPQARQVNCHLKTTVDGQVLQDRDFWFRLKDIEKIVVMTGEQREKEDNTANGHPEYSYRIDPPVFDLGAHISDKKFFDFLFYDEDLANRVAKAMVHAVELCGGGSKPEPF